MKKSDFIEMVAEKAQESKAAVARVVDAIFDASSGAIAETVKAGRDVSIPGFGKFRSKKRAARKGRNPQTGKAIDIPESTVVAFSAGKGFKDSVAGRGTTKKKATSAGSGGAGRSTAKTPAGTKASTAKTPASRASAAKTTGEAKSAGKSTGGSKGGAAKSGTRGTAAKGSAGGKR